MRRIGGRICKAGSEGRAWLDDHDVGAVGREPARQVIRRRGSGDTAAKDGDNGAVAEVLHLHNE